MTKSKVEGLYFKAHDKGLGEDVLIPYENADWHYQRRAELDFEVTRLRYLLLAITMTLAGMTMIAIAQMF